MAFAGALVSWAIAIALAAPCGIFFVEVMLALLPFGKGRGSTSTSSPASSATSDEAPRVAVIIPAHDEETEIGATVKGVRRQLRGADCLLVVADNCGDRTAEVAAAAGATVVKRWSDSKRGKGYALAFGVDRLRKNPPDVVVFIDADCRLEAGALARVAARAHDTGRPVQGLYLMDVPLGASPRDRVSAFAFQVKNEVRAGGLAALSLPCHLTGTAMAWPWSVVDRVNLATGSIVEDLELGISLALAGCPAQLCRDARVFGRLPSQGDAAKTQRRRWEHGFLQTALRLAPRLLWEGVWRRSLGLLALGLDLCVPPLTLLVTLASAGLVVVAGLSAFGFGDPRAALALGVALGLVGLAVLAAWARYARRTLPFSSLLAVPLYVLWKVPIFLSFLWRREQQWVRTARDGEPADGRSSSSTTPRPRP